jgi:hypothetical protein
VLGCAAGQRRLERELLARKWPTSRFRASVRTVADCFRYRNKVGLYVAVEALRAYLRRRGRSVDALMKAAEQTRAARVIRPYLEALA